ncbi:hypothetical protein EJ05DRAFT_472756 [Pseudovirgaria hyperparasitica]|uniref:Tocopherol cyclase n=1 Tax=Pseudovirgaria hyperparasitica TaxID=470096 RepID=A0A6A6WJV9_9PEZI|nr:uncharacterized protein EJ05DRAFT_472756 [Pseudovirgaria hyperparasitica]KAF2761791.1 hypothetical protein EJ05DRAFT_472756 [Pseudovirgaria hyperparasitica]
MDFFRPHPSAAFEGYYSKFTLESGSHIILIFCTVRNAPTRPHMLSFTYIPYHASQKDIFQREIWADNLHMTPIPLPERQEFPWFTRADPFKVSIPSIASLASETMDGVEYEVCGRDLDFKFSAKSGGRVPWIPSSPNSTPAGRFASLPLPLQWHVHSRASFCRYELTLPPSVKLLPEDLAGNARVHIEKNWGQSFPKSHIWIQAWDEDTKRGFCCAGGRILGMEAYLLGYVNGKVGSVREKRGYVVEEKALVANFRPPWTLRVGGWSPFNTVVHDWENRTICMSVSGLRQKIVVSVTAKEGSFFELSAPFADGHRPKFLAESFEGTLDIDVYERSWWGTWRSIQKDRFEDAAVEFGGENYPLRGGEDYKSK